MRSDGVLLRELLLETKDGEWGKEEAFAGSVEMGVIRGTDFDTAGQNALIGVPVRHIAGKAAARKTLMPGDILIETAGGSKGRPTGRTVFLRGDLFRRSGRPLTCASFARFLRVDPRLADPEFVYWFLQSVYKSGEIERYQVQHTGIARFQFTKFADSIKIPVLSRAQQSEVVGVLGSLDDRITLLRETNATLEAIARALFKSWFVDFDPVRAKMEGRAPEGMDEAAAALFPDGFVNSALGSVPTGWRRQRMADVSTVGIGKTPPRKEQHWFSEDANDVRWVSIRDMGNVGVYATRTAEFLTRDAVERCNVRQVPGNTVLLSFKMTIGRVAITDGDMTTNEAIAHFKLLKDAFPTTEYIYLYLKNFDYSMLSSTSSIADAVNSKTVRELPILVPSEAVLQAFQGLIAPLFAKIKNGEMKMQTLATLRDNLLPRLISGQLRLLDGMDAIIENHRPSAL